MKGGSSVEGLRSRNRYYLIPTIEANIPPLQDVSPDNAGIRRFLKNLSRQ
jgi:hypothetical protein